MPSGDLLVRSSFYSPELGCAKLRGARSVDIFVAHSLFTIFTATSPIRGPLVITEKMKLHSGIIILTVCVVFSCQSEIQSKVQSKELVVEEDSTKKTIDTFNLTFSEHIKLYSIKNVYLDTSLNTISDSLDLAIYYSIHGLNKIDSIYKEYKRLSGINNDVVHNEKLKSCFASANTATHPAIDAKSNKHKLWYCYYHFQFRLGFYIAQLQSEIEKLMRKPND